jgi:hypothetical protein
MVRWNPEGIRHGNDPSNGDSARPLRPLDEKANPSSPFFELILHAVVAVFAANLPRSFFVFGGKYQI